MASLTDGTQAGTIKSSGVLPTQYKAPVITSNPSATMTTPSVLSGPAAKTFVDTQLSGGASTTNPLPETSFGEGSNGYQADQLIAGMGTAKTPQDLAGGNTTGVGAGTTQPGLQAGDLTDNAAPQTAYDAAMNTYLASLKSANDISLQSKKDQEAALNSGETTGFASGEAARVNRNNSFAIDAATNLANVNKDAVTAFKDRLPAAPAAFTLNAGDTRYDASGNPIATQAATPKAPQIIGSASTGYFSVDPSTQKLTQLIRPDGTGGSGGGTSAQTIDDWTQAVLGGNATISQVPLNVRTAVAHALNTVDSSGDNGSYSPLASSRYTIASNRIVSNFTQLPQYTLTANGLPYLQRIDAALKTPGSVSDQDLLDSLTKLNTAGNAISDAQVKIITDGRSLSDLANVYSNKLANGGVLSDNQRKQIAEIAKNIFDNYQKGYQPVYDQVTAQLQAAGIPKQFWTIPNLNDLSSKIETGSGGNGGSTLPQNIQEALSTNAVVSTDGKTITVPRSVWSTFGDSMDAVLAEAKKDGVTLLVK